MKLVNRFAKILLVIALISSMMVPMLNMVVASPESRLSLRTFRHSARERQNILVKYKDDSKSDLIRENIKNKLNSNKVILNKLNPSKLKINKLNLKKKFKKQKIELLSIEINYDLDTIDNNKVKNSKNTKEEKNTKVTEDTKDIMDIEDIIDEAIEELLKDPNIEYAHPDYQVSINALSNDTYFAKQWGLSNSGQTIEGQVARMGVDINAQAAWDITQGSNTVIVGVLDTGIDITHEDLINNIDTTNAYNFVAGNNQVYNPEIPVTSAHGTEIAGIIAATANNGKGITGVAPNVKILPLQVIDGRVGYTSDAIDAIEYAMSKGVKIINCSFAGGDNNLALKDAMANSGILFVCAAGNTGVDTTTTPAYPAYFDLPNIISVAAIDGKGVLANFSGYGNGIDVAAPGVNIYTTTSGNSYDYISGTSASAAFVTGEAALLLSKFPTMSATELKARIVNNVVKCTALTGKVTSGGRADAKAALTNIAPAATDAHSGLGWKNITLPGEALGRDADSWYTASQLALIKQQIHYGQSGVNPATGNFSTTVNDLSITSPGFTIDFSRIYNSKDERTSPMGRGWSFGFNGSAIGIDSASDMVVVTLPSGAVERFVKYSDGTYLGSDSRSKFVKNVDNSFVLTTKDQYIYKFSTKGYLTTMSDRYGNTVTITVDTSGKVTGVTDQGGRLYSITYDANNLISQISDPVGRIVKYTYIKPTGLSFYVLAQVTDPMGKNMNYTYDAQGYLETIKDNDSKTIVTLTYDHTNHNASKTTDVSGNVSTYSYDTNNMKTAINENSGARQWTYWYDSSYYITKTQDPEGRHSTTIYNTDANGRNNFGEEKQITDRYGNTTKYDRDGNGNVNKVTNPEGGIKVFQYDTKNNLIMQSDENGKSTYFVYDSDMKYLLNKVQPLDGTTAYSTTADQNKYAITTYTYYTGAETTSLGYKAKGLLKTEINPLGNITTYTYYPDGTVKTVTDGEGKTTTNSYNLIGWKTGSISPNGFNSIYTYDKNGLLIKTELNNGETFRTVYDAMGRKIQEISPNQYVASKENTNTDMYTDNTVGTRYTYYDSGKVSTVTDAAGNKTSYTYDVYGNILTQTKQNGSIYVYTYDIMDRVKTVAFKDYAAAEPALLKEYAYDALENGNTQKTEAVYLNATNKAVTVEVSDYAGRIISSQNPDNTVEKVTYSSNGTVATKSDSNGSVSYYKYDGLNRLTETWTPFEISSGNIVYSYTKIEYDKANNKTVLKIGKDKVTLNNVPTNFATINYSYYKNGKLKSETDSAGRRTDYFYDDDGNMIEKHVYTDSVNKNITEYTYNQIGKVLTQKVHVEARDIAGKDINDISDTILTTTYTYDLNGNLKTITTPNGVTTTNVYDVIDRLLNKSQPSIDEEGTEVTNTTAISYNWDGKPLTSTDANGGVTTYTYNPNGTLKTVKDARGGITAYYYDIAGRKIVEVSPKNFDDTKTLELLNRTEYTYDVMDRIKTKVEKYVDPITNQFVSVITKAYTYDSNGNVVLEQDGLGIDGNYGTRYTYNLAGKQIYIVDPVSEEKGLPYTVKYEYDGLGRKTSETNAKGVIYFYTYDDAGNITDSKVNGQKIKASKYNLVGNTLTTTDGNGNTTTYEYNAYGKVRKVNYEGDSTIPQNTVKYQYDNMGNLSYAQDSLGKVNTYTFDKQGRVLTQTEKKSDRSQVVTTSVRYDKNGNKRYITDANGITTENKYDELNRLSSSKIIVSGVPNVTNYTYDANGNQTIITDFRGNTITNVYDPINRIIEKKDQNSKVVEKLEYNKNNAQIKSTDALNNLTQFIYDKNNRLIATIDPEEHTTSKSYDSVGNVATKTDGRGIVTAYNYDQYNRLASVINAKGEKTVYTYDLNGNMVTQKDAKGNITKFDYNVANKLVKLTDQAGMEEAYTYTADGKLATKTDRNGKTFTYTYDIHGRQIAVIASREDEAISSLSYTYDNNGNQLTVTDSIGTTTRTYDELGRVLTKTVPDIGTSKYVYDITTGVPEGYTKDTTTDPKGNTVTRVYDKVGRMVNVIADGETTTYTYYDNGSKESVVYTDGSREDYTYYKDNLNKTLTNKKSNGTIIDTYEYTYDGAHNQTSKTDAKGVTTYTYDSVNRLESVTEPNGTVTKYSYDKAGNRNTQVVTKDGKTAVTVYTYNEQNRLLTVTTVSDGIVDKTVYTYDNNGNQISSAHSIVKAATGADATLTIVAAGSSPGTEVTLNTYDVWNQLVKTIIDDKIVTNAYNGEGYRVSKTVNGDTTNYLYEGDKVILEVDGSGAEKAHNVYGTHLVSRTVEGQTLYYMYNGHADVTALLDNDGNIVATYYYDAFGNIVEQTGNADNNITYAGYQYDKETGLYYLNARMYDPVTARFLQEDTYRGDRNDPLSLNLYTYCHNEPMMYTDPTGHLRQGDILQNGSKNSDVKKLQQALVKAGYSVGKAGADGVFGKDTLAAVNKYKTDNKLQNNTSLTAGKVGATTWQHLGLKLDESTSSKGSSSSTTATKSTSTIKAPAQEVKSVPVQQKNWWDNTVDYVGDKAIKVSYGVTSSVDDNLFFGAGDVVAKKLSGKETSEKITNSLTYQVTRLLTDAGCATYGIVTTAVGIGEIGAGGGISLTGGGAVVGVPAIATGTATTAYGAAVTGRSFDNAVDNAGNLVERFTGGGSGGKTLNSSRQAAVKDAWKQEQQLVRETGQGTRPWSATEKKELLETGKVKGYEGHHINSVNNNPELARDPNNIKFVKGRSEHLQEHGGNFRNSTSGDFINRK